MNLTISTRGGRSGRAARSPIGLARFFGLRAPVRADVSGIGLNPVRVGLTYRVGLSRSARLFSLGKFFFHLRQIDDEISCYILVIHYDYFKSF